MVLTGPCTRLALQDGGAARPARAPDEGDYRWPLLSRIAQVRWIAVALAVGYAFLANPAPAARWSLLVPAAAACAYNSVITVRARADAGGAAVLTAVSLVGDFLWVTAAAATLAVVDGQWTATIGYVTVGSECGLLVAWPGVAVAVLGGGMVQAAAELLGPRLPGGRLDPVRLLYGIATLVAATGAAALAASELRTQHRNLQAQSARLAVHARTDPLTGLANAYALDEALARIGARPYGLLLVDVDGMRWVNNVYGHESGDELLHSVARILTAVIEEGELAARVGEDKFVVVLPGVTSHRVAERAERIRAATHAVGVSAGRLRVSVGCAWTETPVAPREVMLRADDALLGAKTAGGDRVEMQSPVDRPGRWRMRTTVESIIADDRGVYSVYQRIVGLRDGRTVGWEALSRPHDWPPDVSVEALFLTAHHIGRSRELDWRCRRTALWQASRLDAPLFVNVDVGALVDPVHGVDQMSLMCEWAGRPTESVVLELSERTGIPDLRRLVEVLAEYRSAGFRFALDDLGEGQTSFELMLAARPEFFKLARELVRAASGGVAAYAAVRALVGFAHDIGSSVIAEGIENESTRDLCVELGVDHGQGWLFGRPQPADRLRTA